MHFLSVLICCIALMFSSTVSADVSTLVADTKSGLILSSSNSLKQQYPASLTKVMTLYLTFNALENGLLKMNDRLPVSRKAARQPRSKLYVKAGQTISVQDAIMALIIVSANDVAVVLAEALAPSEEAFAKMMTNTARDLGLKNTTFKNASGLHNPEQVTTAQDMAVLTMAMINHFPQYYKLFSKKSFTYRGRQYKTHNHVQKKYVGAEGLKTGYISAVGYNIISTAKRKNHRLVSVVIGQDTVALRDKQAMRLLDKGFSKIKTQQTAFKRLNKSQSLSALNKTAVLSRPDMRPYLKIMAKRLDQTVKTSAPRKQKLLALALPPIEPEEPESDSIPSMGDSDVEKEAVGLEIKEDVSAGKDDKSLSAEVLSETDPKTADTEKEETRNVIIADVSKEVVDNKEEIVASSNEIKNNDTAEKEKTVAEPNLKMLADNQSAPLVDVVQEEQTPTSWGIQVGAFKSQEVAYAQAQKALKILKIKNKTIHTPRAEAVFRSRLVGFSSGKEARNACKKLKNKKIQCLSFAPEKN